ncbi:hypothetical protein TSOC_007366 [Tetrabaena socialis]|uniref:Dolichyl-diphosphooligosaccharide--protein glycosyltransferase subunit 1 n=1 Tax=Tetrabaena socialis TaxID=47790 RepID=A0A2J8A183_9CHLO|nr:hypothetical protein TSOC_007366 [Tetrabaena socialis]|eukprot:PNH06279.1 hypothetical protein TSOC_007366 [Tetrabaena socialis]
MRQHLLVAALLLALASGTVADIKLQQVDRKINLNSQFVRITELIKAKNVGGSPVSALIFCQKLGEGAVLASYKAVQSVQGGERTELTAVPVTDVGAPAGVVCHSVKLAGPLPPTEVASVTVNAVLAKAQVAYPAELTQIESQLMLFKDNVYVLSPYSVSAQSTEVVTPSNVIKSYTEEKPVSKSDNKIKYGKYDLIKPFTVKELSVHFENNKPFKHVLTLVREIEVSHWGNIYVEEHYEILNAGAKHSGSFSRLKYAHSYNGKANSFRDLKAVLPAAAHSLYYVDLIGNISSSNTRKTLQSTVLDFELRFPLMGGWKVDFTLGYSVPLAGSLFHAKGGKRRLTMDLASPLEDVFVEDMIVKVVLPEGSSNLKPILPYEVEQSYETKYTYLDTTGRPVLVLHKRNVASPEHAAKFTLEYSFGAIHTLREPLLLVKPLLAAVESRSAREAGRVREVLEKARAQQGRYTRQLSDRIEAVKKGGSMSEITRKLSPGAEAISQAKRELEASIATVFGAWATANSVRKIATGEGTPPDDGGGQHQLTDFLTTLITYPALYIFATASVSAPEGVGNADPGPKGRGGRAAAFIARKAKALPLPGLGGRAASGEEQAPYPQVTGGRNGYGAKLANIFSSEFTIFLGFFRSFLRLLATGLALQGMALRLMGTGATILSGAVAFTVVISIALSILSAALTIGGVAADAMAALLRRLASATELVAARSHRGYVRQQLEGDLVGPRTLDAASFEELEDLFISQLAPRLRLSLAPSGLSFNWRAVVGIAGTMARCATLLALLAAVLALASAKIHHSIVEKDDRPLIPLSDAFGFAEGGKLDISIRDIGLYRLHGSQEDISNWEKFGFFLSPVEADAALEQDLTDNTKCILNDVNNLFTFKDSSVQNVIQGKLDNFTFHFVVQNGGLFYLYFANCEPDTPVSFNSLIEMYNVDSKGRKDYLSVGDTSLDAVYWAGAVLLLRLLAWKRVGLACAPTSAEALKYVFVLGAAGAGRATTFARLAHLPVDYELPSNVPAEIRPVQRLPGAYAVLVSGLDAKDPRVAARASHFANLEHGVFSVLVFVSFNWRAVVGIAGTMARCATLLALLAAVLALASAKIHHSIVEKDDRPLIPLSDAFGFAEGGKLDISIRDIGLYRLHGSQEDISNWEKFGFFLSPVEADAALEQDLTDNTKCILNDVNNLFTFKDSSVQNVIQGKLDNFTFHFVVQNGGLFYLYFANCEPDTPVSFNSLIEMYNVDSKGRKDYLSVGDTSLDAVYWSMFATFVACTAAWAMWVLRNKQYSHKIHYLMFGLGCFKALTLLSQALMVYYIERSGSADGWNVVYYVFTFLRGILFFTVVVLIGTGWSLMKPFLGDKEQRIIMIVIPLQVLANMAIIITEEESPSTKDWFTWRDVFHLVDIICCCAILFPIVWSIKNLREASQTDGKAARNLEKLTLFRQFYVMVVVYIYFTRIVVYLLKSTMQYEFSWVSAAAEELATLTFYVWTAVKFRPMNENPYLKVAGDIEL